MLLPKWLIFQFNFGAKTFWNLTLHSCYYCNFIDDIIPDQWKVVFEKKKLFKFCNLGKVLHTIVIQKSILHVHENAVFQVLQATWSVSIEDSKPYEISKLTVGPYFEMLWLCNLATQNLVFWQLVDFDYVDSHLISM